MTPRVLLHATDFSPASRRAFAKALELAKESRARLLIAHARSTVVPMVDGYTAVEVYEEVQRAGRAHATRQLERLVARAREAGVRAEPLLLEGVAADQIVRAARRHKADMIVIGTHGRTGLGRLFLGSVAARVVATADCPVLTVRGAGGRGR
jgi:nucleotide-binding universal stress UspA family protein